MKRIIFVVATIFTLCVSGTTGAQAETPSDLSPNAALRYWPAFDQLPVGGSAAAEAIDQWDTVEIEIARPFVANNPPALTGLSWANEIEACDWGIRREAGLFALLPHLSPARELTRFSLMRARVRLHDGDDEGAIADALAVMKMGRACGHDLILISSLVDISIESHVVNWAASNLSAFDNEALASMQEGVPRLSRRPNPSQVIQGEGDIFLGWFAHELKEGDGPLFVRLVEQQIEEFHDGVVGGDVDAEEVEEEALDLAQWIEWAEEAREVYGEAAHIADMPWPDYREAIKELEAGIDASDNRVLKVFMPSVGGARGALDRAEARLAMLNAMIALRLGGLDAEATTVAMQDPFGDNPFEFIVEEIDHEEWIVGLRSVLSHHDEPVELRADRVIRR